MCLWLKKVPGIRIGSFLRCVSRVERQDRTLIRPLKSHCLLEVVFCWVYLSRKYGYCYTVILLLYCYTTILLYYCTVILTTTTLLYCYTVILTIIGLGLGLLSRVAAKSLPGFSLEAHKRKKTFVSPIQQPKTSTIYTTDTHNRYCLYWGDGTKSAGTINWPRREKRPQRVQRDLNLILALYLLPVFALGFVSVPCALLVLLQLQRLHSDPPPFRKTGGTTLTLTLTPPLICMPSCFWREGFSICSLAATRVKLCIHTMLPALSIQNLFCVSIFAHEKIARQDS